MSDKISIEFEKIEIDGNIYDRSKYPPEGGRFIAYDGVARNMVIVPKGDRSAIYYVPLPEEIVVNEVTEQLKTDFSSLIKEELEAIYTKLSTVKQTSQSGISEETLLRLAEIMNK